MIEKTETAIFKCRESEMIQMQDEQTYETGAGMPAESGGSALNPGGRSVPNQERPRFKPELQTEPGKRMAAVSRSRRRTPVDRILPVLLLAALLLAGVGGGVGIGYLLWGRETASTVDLKAIKSPEWIEQRLLRKNIFSRPDVSMRKVNNIVVHYVGNPNTSAEANQRYFDSLADQDPEQGGTSSSSHFIVGLEGEILQCIPIGEISYANGPRNFDTVTIEVCHPDESGKFNDASYASLVKLTAWLCEELELDEKDVIRHYDVNGKACPKYFVDHEDAWKQFRKDVKEALKNQ